MPRRSCASDSRPREERRVHHPNRFPPPNERMRGARGHGLHRGAGGAGHHARHCGADPTDPRAYRGSARGGRVVQGQDPARQHLAREHRDLRRDECGVGRVGRPRPPAGACDGGGEAGEAGVPCRDHGDRSAMITRTRRDVMRFGWIATLAIFAAPPAFAQSEAVLREAFEGKTVRVRIDMPATSAGINVRPEEKPPVDYVRLGDLMKREGTSLRAGDLVMVTKVKTYKNLVEFQLGGGGYGTFGDMMHSSPTSSAADLGKSGREKDLEDQIRRSSDPARKKSLERELKDERRHRESENARSQAEANQANELREGNIQQLR